MDSDSTSSGEFMPNPMPTILHLSAVLQVQRSALGTCAYCNPQPTL